MHGFYACRAASGAWAYIADELRAGTACDYAARAVVVDLCGTPLTMMVISVSTTDQTSPANCCSASA
ncbi:hypothetical protein GCM10011609_88020 [Lentzea pudingi]|uniref:Uncharacterized protein n=1 Tax=Lentzea pudingi TaxID=1789439 RepID=A0ABQ2IXJ2_9PSEU|nr:hypothetical protein GCM10011609_88020 [Lentzea pudingi]